MGKEQVNMADTSELSLSNASNEKFWPNGWWKLFDLKARIQIISATVMDWRRGEASC